MKFDIAAVLGSLLIASSAWAAAPSDEAIETLLTVTKLEGLSQKMVSDADQMMVSMAMQLANSQGKPMTAAQERQLDAVMKKAAELMREELSWAKLKPLYTQIYRETFTQEEVEGMVAFYRTPVGAAMIDKMPQVMQRSMELSRSRMLPMMQKMQAAMEEAVRQGAGDGRRSGKKMEGR